MKALADSYLREMERLIAEGPSDPGKCIVCGAETYNIRLNGLGREVYICDLTLGEGLACMQVWRLRKRREQLPPRHVWLQKNRTALDDLVLSDDPYDYELLEVPWQDDRDGYHDYKSYIRSREWNVRAWWAKAHRGWRCERCQKRGTSNTLHAHHKTYTHLFHERKADVEVLCAGCHEDEHFGSTAELPY